VAAGSVLGAAHFLGEEFVVFVVVSKVVIDELGGTHIGESLDLVELLLLILEGRGFEDNDDAPARRIGHVHVGAGTNPEVAYTVRDCTRGAGDKKSRVLHEGYLLNSDRTVRYCIAGCDFSRPKVPDPDVI